MYTCSHRLTARFIRRYHSKHAGIRPPPPSLCNTISPHAQLLRLYARVSFTFSIFPFIYFLLVLLS